MAEEVIIKKTTGTGKIIFWTVVIVLVILLLFWFLMQMHRQIFSYNQGTINSLIAALVASPPNPFPIGMTTVTATSILQEQVSLMVKNQNTMAAASNYSKLTAMPIEQVLVNEAYVTVHNYGWL